MAATSFPLSAVRPVAGTGILREVFGSVLVANRGEIACRVIGTLRRLGIEAVAVHSDADAGAKHIRLADRAVPIGEAPAAGSYLNPGGIVQAALAAGVDAVHPGYGFLSESASFARACLGAGLAWVGPPPEVLELAGDKIAARRAFEASGFPVLPGAGPFTDPGAAAEAAVAADAIGYPVMVKAVMGGGGIGMGVAADVDALAKAVDTASTRGARFFADPAIYLERYVPGSRHVEVQVLFDADGRGVHLYERECSVQRRHQKVMEETPSPAVGRDLLRRMTHAAMRSMGAIGYVGAGTVECLLTPEGEFFFLEVNARLQVEHPVTEVTCGVDLVEQQLRIASGDGMSVDDTPPRNGHALECRIYAEDPRTFLPAPGRIERLSFGQAGLAAHYRYDFGYEAGDDVPMFYDPLIGKVVVHGHGRATSVAMMRSALDQLSIEGIKTNVPALRAVLEDEGFAAGRYDTGLLGK